MIKTFTENELVRYLYEESSASENVEIRNALLCDSSLEELFSELKFSSSLLDRLSFSPSKLSLDGIFDFSNNFSLKDNLK